MEIELENITGELTGIYFTFDLGKTGTSIPVNIPGDQAETILDPTKLNDFKEIMAIFMAHYIEYGEE